MSSILHKSMTLKEWSLLIVLSFLWGGSFIFTSIIVKALPPFTIVFLRVALAAISLNIVVYGMGQRMPHKAQPWVAFFWMGLLNNVVPFCLIVWGQIYITSGLASILNATTPLFAVVIAHMLTKDEKMTKNRLFGVVIGFLGVAVMVGPGVLFSGIGSTHIVAQCAILGAALSYSLAGIYGRRFKTMGMAPFVTATGQLTMSALILLPVALLVDHPWALPLPHFEVWGAVLGSALLSTSLAYILYFRILTTAGVTNLMLVTFLIPISAIFMGFVLFDERLRAVSFLGMGLIGLGLVAIDGRIFKCLDKMIGPRTIRLFDQGDGI